MSFCIKNAIIAHNYKLFNQFDQLFNQFFFIKYLIDCHILCILLIWMTQPKCYVEKISFSNLLKLNK